ncbi:MAG: HlyD family efflux transporter periplasmic adaptor subunit [Pirellulales bacterium]|nr:HlyD family efflux transporter periplasmic adaptor subunit [Pirellulales bacterium]
MKTSHWIGIGTVVILLLALAWSLGWLSGGTPVETATVHRGAIDAFIDEQAKTRLPQTYLITMPAQGRIKEITRTEGRNVTEGEVVAEIVPRDLDLAVAEAAAVVDRLKASIVENANVEVEETAYEQSLSFVKSTAATVKAAYERLRAGEAKMAYANNNFRRVESLFHQSKTATQDELETAKLQKVQGDVDYQQDKLIYVAMQAMEAATNLMPIMVKQYIKRKGLTEPVLQKQKAEAEARLKQIELDRERGQMRSPVTGKVLRRFVSNERFLAAGTKLLEIGRLEDMEVEADVLTLDVVAAKVGDEVEIYGPAIGEKPVKGFVTQIYPAGFTKISSLGVEQQRVKVVIRFQKGVLERLLTEQHLGVGYAVRVKIKTGKAPHALIIPRSAMFRSLKNTWQVFAVRNGRARLQDVEVGLMNDAQAEIQKGLEEGDEVILAPESSLENGTKVQVQKE